MKRAHALLSRSSVRLDAALACIVAGAYVLSLWGTTVWDDEYLTTRNPYLAFSSDNVRALLTNDLWMASAKEEPSGYYRPLASLSYAVNQWVLGNSSSSYHAGNVLVHILVVVALHRLLRELHPSRTILPFVFAMFFGVAPITSEAVCWLAGRFDLLAALFMLLTIRAHGRGQGGAATGRSFSVLMQVYASIAFIAAILSKETAVIAPVILVLYDLVCRRFRLSRLYVHAVLGASIIAYFVLRHSLQIGSASTSTELLFTGVALRGYVWCVALAAATAAGAIAPSIFHVFRDPGWQYAGIGAGVIVVVTIVLVLLRRRAPSALFGWLWMLIALLPVGLTSPRLSQIGDRYAYFAFAGLIVCAAGVVDLLAHRGYRWITATLTTGLVIHALVHIVTLERRIGDWKDEDTFYMRELARDPGRYWAALQLGERRAKQGRYPEAEELLLRARSMSGSFRIHVGLCYVYLNQQRFKEAVESCDRALEINPADPRGLVNRGHAHLALLHRKKALRDAETAIALKPSYAEAHFLRASSLASLGDRAQAIEEARRTLALNARHAKAAWLLSELQQPQPQPPPPEQVPK